MGTKKCANLHPHNMDIHIQRINGKKKLEGTLRIISNDNLAPFGHLAQIGQQYQQFV